MSILVTGANGFVGKYLVKTLLESNIEVKTLSTKPNDFKSVSSYKLNLECDYLCENPSFLNDVNCIVHLAGLAHRNGIDEPSEEDYMQVNYYYPLKLARLAVDNGVKRFVFVSTIGVNDSSTSSPIDSRSPVFPNSIYAQSKYRAEQKLIKIAKYTGLELVIIRPPLVYGKGAPGNFGTLLSVAKMNFPLPLGSLNNSRSFVYVENLVDLIATCIDHPKAVNNVFMVSDGVDVSMSSFLTKLIISSDQKPILFPFPVILLKILFNIIRRGDVFEKISTSLLVNIDHTKKTLDWEPPIDLDEAIRRCF